MTKPIAIAFLGPSLPHAEAQQLFPRAELRGPARQGDVLRAVRDAPRAIVLVDGVFESQPSVWHQELRIALSQGICVIGGSSMGALRAVELAPFGMIGVGAVYRAYAEGRLVDDADVALLHAAAEHDHRALTTPFVNVVATAEHALEHEALTTTEARALLRAARALHYKDRRWPTLLASLPWSAAKKTAFEAFRRAHPQDVKADDARECLTTARDLCAKLPAGKHDPLTSLSVWARRAWLAEQGAPPDADAESGLRTLLLADWARSHGLVPEPDRVARFDHAGAKLKLDAGLRRRYAEALALEEQLVDDPGLLLPQAPGLEEGPWVDAMRRASKKPPGRAR